MSLVENIIIRRLQRLIPDWSNAEEVRLFAVKVVAVLDGLAEETETEVDDLILDGVAKFLENQQAWGTLYSLLLDLLGDDAGSVAEDSRVSVLAGDVEMDPATIILIINAIIAAVKWWKNR